MQLIVSCRLIFMGSLLIRSIFIINMSPPFHTTHGSAYQTRSIGFKKKCIEDQLAIDCLVYRYKPENAEFFGLQEGEGNFSACSFWFIECLSRSGQLQKAQ